MRNSRPTFASSLLLVAVIVLLGLPALSPLPARGPSSPVRRSTSTLAPPTCRGVAGSPCGLRAAVLPTRGPLPTFGPWVQLVNGSTTRSPSGRSSSAMAYDPLLRETILFGGYDFSVAADGDTWALSGGVWTDLTPGLSQSPPAEWGGSLVYDPLVAGLVLFGGRDTSGFYNSTWLFNATGWWDISKKVSPSPRMEMAMDYDPTDGYLLGFGGEYNTGSSWVSYNDTWKFANQVWTRLAPSHGVAPPAASFGTGTWDAIDGYFLVFGGGATIGACGSVGQTWSWVSGSWTNRTDPVHPGPPDPGGLWGTMYDPRNFSVLAFGGYPISGSCASPANETWVYRAGHWSNLTAVLPVTPINRCCQASTYDPTESGLVIFGGNANPLVGGRLNDTWSFEGRGEVGFAATPDPADAGRSVAFNGSSGALPTPVQWNWSFGDGTGRTNAGPNVSHAYSGAGRYSVWANVTDGNGTVWPCLQEMDVNPALSVSANILSRVGDAPARFDFRANLSGGTPALDAYWNFSDGYRSTTVTGTHTIAAAGSYSANLTVRDAAGSARFANFSLLVNPTLGASVSLSPLRGFAPLRVSADANLSGGTPPVNATWDFGTGPAGVVGAVVTNYTYQNPGNYRATFRSRDGAGGQAGANFSVDVLAPLQLYLNASSTVGVAPFTVYFSGSAFGGGGQFQYGWHFDDGSPNTTGVTPAHQFENPGRYRVTLTATDRYGYAINRTLDVLTVAPLQASVTADVGRGVAPLNVTFALSTQGGYGALVGLWSFGDGASGHGNTTLSHIFAGAGSFRVTLTLADGLLEIVSHSLTVDTYAPLTAALSASSNRSEVNGTVAFDLVAAKGLPPYAYRWGGLPADCGIGNHSHGVCATSHPGSYAIYAVVGDALGQSVNRSLTITWYSNATSPGSLVDHGQPANGLVTWVLFAAGAGVVVAASLLVLGLRRRHQRGALRDPSGSDPYAHSDPGEGAVPRGESDPAGPVDPGPPPGPN